MLPTTVSRPLGIAFIVGTGILFTSLLLGIGWSLLDYGSLPPVRHNKILELAITRTFEEEGADAAVREMHQATRVFYGRPNMARDLREMV